MLFNIQLIFIIILFLLNIASYVWTFPSSFALRNEDFYDIISIFNDFIFISCSIAGFSSLKKSKTTSSIIFLCIPMIYTLILILNFR